MYNDFIKTLNVIKKNRDRAISGKFNAIPFGFPRFDEQFPGIIQGLLYCVTAATNSSKTQFTKNIFVQQAYKFCKANNIKLKVIWFGLEESIPEFYSHMISNKLYHANDLVVDGNVLMSRKTHNGKQVPLDQDILHRIEEHTDYFADFSSCVEMIDYEYNAYNMYKKILVHAIKNGKFYKELENKSKVEMTPVLKGNVYEFMYKENDSIKTATTFDEYVPDNPDEVVIVVTDHGSLIDPDTESPSLHSVMQKFASKYLRQIVCKRFNYAAVVVHQQAMDGDNQDFKEKSITPSLSKLGDNLTQVVNKSRESGKICLN